MEQRVCKTCQQDFIIADDDQQFYAKIVVPSPTRCPRCRAIRRMLWWNEHNLYRKTPYQPSTIRYLGGTGSASTPIFSTYPESSPITIMDRDAWWGDSWDPLEYGREYDPSRPFFDQFKKLLQTVPWPSRDVQRLVNSDYSNQASDLKNCYLVFNTGKSEDCLYGVASLGMRTSLDFYFSGKSELCCEVMNIENCYATFFSIDVTNCRNVWFSRDCHDCSDCFGCANLRSAQYRIFNEPYRKEEYFARIKEMNLGSYGGLRQAQDKAITLWKSQPYRYAHALQNTRSVGDYLYNSKNARYCYQVLDAENLAYCQNMSRGIKDSLDYTNWGNNAELIYESVGVGENVRNLKFCFNCWPGSTDLEYCVNVMSSANCFGCVGLRKKEYCILNKQYTKEEYEKSKCLIIQHMRDNSTYGEFFPPEMSPLAYNESVAIDYFPMTKEEAAAAGYLWREPENRAYEITMTKHQIPDNIKDVNDQITKEIIECASCKRAYRILDRELEFYQRFNIPVPRLCHRCRFRERTRQLNPMQWWKRACAKCGVEVETTFAPDRPETIFCEVCYQNEVG